MPAALPPPVTEAEAASAWIREVRAVTRERFARGALAVRPDLAASELRVITGHAEDFACQLLDACGFPWEAGELREMAAREREADAGTGGAA
jgi:uncharacterized membrane protein